MMIRYLTHMFTVKNAKYSYLTGIRTVLNKYVHRSYHDELKIDQFMKGAHNLKPPVSKYVAIWDPDRLLNHIMLIQPVSLKNTSYKLACLFMILAGTRINTLSHLKITNMFLTDQEVTFTFSDCLKHSRRGFKTAPITYRAFPHNSQLCPVIALRQYMEYRLTISNDPHLFVILVKPHRAASADTLARWVKTCMGESGIDIGKFSAHSCRSSSTSKASFIGVNLKDIMRAAGWSVESTFRRFYEKEIIDSVEDNNIGLNILKKYV